MEKFTPENKGSSKNERLESTPRAEVNIFYMRHGKPEGQYGSENMPYEEFIKAITVDDSVKLKLSKEGRDKVFSELEAVGIENHDIQIILASPYARTRETAEIVQEYIRQKTGKEIPIRATELLSEVPFDTNIISREEYEALLQKGGLMDVLNEYTKRWLLNETSTENAGESYERAAKLLKYLRRIRKWTRYQKIFMVSHGWFGRVIKHVAQGGRPEDFEKDTKFFVEAEMYALKHNNDDQFIEVSFKK